MKQKKSFVCMCHVFICICVCVWERNVISHTTLSWLWRLNNGTESGCLVIKFRRLQHSTAVLFWCTLADWTDRRKDDKRPDWEWEDEWFCWKVLLVRCQQSYWHLRLDNFVDNVAWAPFSKDLNVSVQKSTEEGQPKAELRRWPHQ